MWSVFLCSIKADLPLKSMSHILHLNFWLSLVVGVCLETGSLVSEASVTTSFWCLYQQDSPRSRQFGRFLHSLTMWFSFLCTIISLNSDNLSGQFLHLYWFSCFLSTISGMWPVNTLCLSRRFLVVVWKSHLSQLNSSPFMWFSSMWRVNVLFLANPWPQVSQMKFSACVSSIWRFSRKSLVTGFKSEFWAQFHVIFHMHL